MWLYMRGDVRNKIEIQFYLIAILFLIFDLEIIYLFPWILILNSLSGFGLFSMIFFIIILMFGFIYE